MNKKELKIKLNELCDIKQKVEKERHIIQKKYDATSYLDNSYLIGKCFKENNHYYKIIDLEIKNEFRCNVLTFFNEKINYYNITKDNFLCVPSFAKELNNLKPYIPTVESIMINSFFNNREREEISSEEFERLYIEQCYRILKVGDLLRGERCAAANKIISSGDSGE